MRLPELRAFASLAESGSFTLAALDLGLSQQAVSRSITSLETRYGVQLFLRHTRAVELTAAGRALVPGARKALAAFSALETALSNAAEASTRPLRIAYTVSSRELVVNEFYPRLQKKGLQSYLIEQSSAQQERELLAGRLDAALLHPPLSRAGMTQLSAMPLASEALYAVLPPKHPLRKRAALQLAELAELPWMLFDREQGPYLYDRAIQGLRKGNRKPEIRGHFMPHHVRADAALRAGCVTLIAKAAIGAMQEPAAFVPLSDLDLPLSLVWRKGFQHPALSFIQSYLKRQEAGLQKLS